MFTLRQTGCKWRHFGGGFVLVLILRWACPVYLHFNRHKGVRQSARRLRIRLRGQCSFTPCVDLYRGAPLNPKERQLTKQITDYKSASGYISAFLVMQSEQPPCAHSVRVQKQNMFTTTVHADQTVISALLTSAARVKVCDSAQHICSKQGWKISKYLDVLWSVISIFALLCMEILASSRTASVFASAALKDSFVDV